MVQCATCSNDAKTDLLVEPYNKTKEIDNTDTSVCWECYNKLLASSAGRGYSALVCPSCSGSSPVFMESENDNDWECLECGFSKSMSATHR